MALKGDNGCIVVLSVASMQQIASLKINGVLACMAFSSDGAVLAAAGSDNRIYIWNSADWNCINVIGDDSGTACTSIAISLGIINFYALEELLNEGITAKPYRSLENLTTEISSIVFHPNSELLIYASKDKQASVRAVHLSTGRVYSNWPSQTSPVGYVNALAFDPSGKNLAIGNRKGNVLMYSLKHYEL